MPRKSQGLTEIELQLMLICWDKGESPASVVYDELNKKQKRSYSAVKTELDRLVFKGYLNRRKVGHAWLFAPAVKKTDVMPSVFDRVILNVLDNSILPLFVHFVNTKKISKEEIEYIKDLLDRAECGPR